MSIRTAPLPRVLLAAMLCATAATGQALAQSHAHHHKADTDTDPHAHHQAHGHANHAGHAPAEEDHDPHAGHAHHGHAAHPEHADHSGHAGHAGQPQEHADHTDHSGHADHASHEQHGHHQQALLQPREPIPPITDADRAAAFPVLHHRMTHDAGINFRTVFDRFEWQDADAGAAFAWSNRTWIGGDLNRLWLRSGGERVAGSTHAAHIEVLYGRSVAAWWDMVAGIRHDTLPGSSRTWAALGVQGTAPYRFEVTATAYLGESGNTALRAEVEYELLLTNRLVLKPVAGITAYGQADPARGTGSGLATSELGLRLRYEIDRRFAPYIGVSSERSHGRTADLRYQAHGKPHETRFVAGVRWWF